MSLKAIGIAVLIVVVSLGAAPAAAGQNPELRVSEAAASWIPHQEYVRAMLSVNMPSGKVVQWEFGDEAITVAATDLEGDGSYTWELVLQPKLDEKTREALREARESGDSEVPVQLQKAGVLPRRDDVVYSGHLQLLRGSFVNAAEKEVAQPSTAAKDGQIIDKDVATRDVVYSDDVIVDGSLCVGFDCINGENFGFDTIRLKENNLRIKFQDTSNSASFPSNDWQLTANDSSSGGANKFSVDDIDSGRTPFTIEAGTRSNALYVEDFGRIGLGTSTPAVELDIRDGDTPTVRLNQDGSSGWAPQIWDMAGNESNFFIRDVTNGSQLPFRIFPGADSNSLLIGANNFVGINTGTSPGARLHVVDNDSEAVGLFESDEGRTKITLTNRKSTATTWAFSVEGLTDDFRISKQGTGGREFGVASDGTVTIGPGGTTVFRLDPSGNIYISGTATENTTPDYVFDADYDLMPLPELADFVATKKHLPSIPSAEEVNTNGLSMTEMQLKLLEKVEELTLYTIEQHREIEALRAELEALKSGR